MGPGDVVVVPVEGCGFVGVWGGVGVVFVGVVVGWGVGLVGELRVGVFGWSVGVLGGAEGLG